MLFELSMKKCITLSTDEHAHMHCLVGTVSVCKRVRMELDKASDLEIAPLQSCIGTFEVISFAHMRSTIFSAVYVHFK